MKALSTIEQFGAIDADADDILQDCFADHQAYLRLLDLSKFLVVGRKGSGKTAIYRQVIRNPAHNMFALGHNFEDYPWHLHDKQAAVGIPDHEKYIHSWRYLILIAISKVLLNFDNSQPWCDDAVDCLSRIERFVVDTYGTNDPDVTQVFQDTKKLRVNPTLGLDIGIFKAGISPDSVPMDKLPTIIQEVNRNLLDYTVRSLNPEHRYYICFDQLDLNFDPNSAGYRSRLIGLLLAARDINLAAREGKKSLLCGVFLRDDIYSILHFEDKNKLTQNFVSTIQWDEVGSGMSLKKLMEIRFTKLLRTDSAISWNQVFDETKEMPGHQTKYKHILDRTFFRPRDIIMFCNKVLEKHKDRVNREPSTGSPNFVNSDIHEARDEYSRYLLDELDDEMHKHLPIYKTYLEVVKSVGLWQFQWDEFSETCAKRKNLFKEATEPREILRGLFDFSVVGYYRVGGSGYGGSEYIFRHADPKAQFDESATRFRVHPGLIEALGLKRN